MRRLSIHCLLLLLTLALPAFGQDPVTNDPATVDWDHPPAMRETSFDSHGSRLNAIVYLAQGAGPHATVVLLHGYPGNEKNLDLAQALRRSGINVLFFHYRGSWGSPGDYSIGNLLEDAASALDYLLAHAADLRVDPERIGLVGHSMGGFVALMTAADDPDIRCTVSIAGANLGVLGSRLRSDPGFAEPLAGALQAGTGPLRGTSGQALVEEIRAGADAYDLVQRAGTLADRKLLLIAGYRDQALPLGQHHEPLVEALKEHGAEETTQVVLDADHSFSAKRIELARTISHWMQQTCGF